MSTETKSAGNPNKREEANLKTINMETDTHSDDTNLDVSKKQQVTAPEIDFDDLLTSAGEFGRYQMLLFALTMPFYVFGVFVYFSQLFMTEAPSQHWCWIPELENLTAIERRSLAIPNDDSARYGFAQCKSYAANWTEVLVTGEKPDLNWPTTPCQDGWEFDKSDIPYPTISTEWGWVCDKDSYQANAQSIFFFGSILGGFLFGWMADKYGRLPVMVLSNVVGFIGGIASMFARNFTEFAVFRFFMGMAYDNCMMMTYLLVLEYIAPRYRTRIANVSFAFFYTLGAVALPWIALACGHWKTIALATSIPCLLALLTPFVFLESPRWLLSKGRVDEAIKKLQIVGRVNGKEVPPKLIEQFKIVASKQKEEEHTSVLELLKRPPLRKSFLITCIVYMCIGIIFDALVRSIGQLDFNFFVSFSIVSFTEFPSLLLVAFFMDWFGRRWLTTLVLLVSALFSVATAVIGGGLPSVLCAVIARFAVNIAYSAMMQWMAEWMPTPVRGSGVALVHISGSVATVISPYVVYLDTMMRGLPLMVVGAVALLGAVLSLWLPETTRKDLPQTFDEAEDLVSKQRFWELPCLSRKTVDDGQVNASYEL